MELGEQIFVHKTCRVRLLKAKVKRCRSVEDLPGPSKKLRSSSNESSFYWKNCCFLCAKDIATTNVRRDGVHQVETLVTKQGE